MRKFLSAMTLSFGALAILTLVGCGQASKGTFAAILSKRLQATGPYISERGFAEFPKTFPQDSEESRNVFPPLIEAGVLTCVEAPYEQHFKRGGTPGVKIVPGFRYDLTPESSKLQFRFKNQDIFGPTGGFYAGQYELVDVVRFTEPADMFGHKVSQVTYTYRVKPSSIPNWATNEAMRQKYKVLSNLEKTETKTEAFILTSDGWIHEDEMRR